MGPILGAEFLVAVGDICAFSSIDRLAAYAGLVPAAKDSGKRVGKHSTMRGGNKTLKRDFSTSRRLPLCGLHRSLEPSTSAIGLRARDILKPSSHSLAVGSTSFGRC
jgi:hypothetical protein